jgi:membrane protein YfhO
VHKEVVRIRKGKDITAVLALTAMLMWFCDELIFSGKIPVFRDLISYFYPIKFSVAEAFRSGKLPLWDRHMAGGFPVLAEFQSAVFYPPSIAFLILPFYAGIQATFVFHYGLALFGSYVLFRSWKYSAFVSIIGSILFAFGGTIVSLTNLLNHFQSAVWLPLVVFLWERILKSERWRDFAIFAIVLTCQLLAGSPEIFVLSLALLLLDAARMKHEGEIASIVRSLGILAGAGVVLIGLGMVQLLPTGELIMQSRRDQAIPAIEALAWSLRPSSLIGLLLPTLEADASLPLGASLLFTQGVPFLLSRYLGVIAIYGVCAWFWQASTRERFCITALLTLSLVLAFGHFTPVYPLLYEWFPVFRALRFPEKFFYVTHALLVFAGVRGVKYLFDGEDSRSPPIAIGLVAVWVIVYGICRWNPLLIAQIMQHSEATNLLSNGTAANLARILFSLEKQIAISLVLTVLLVFRRLNWLRPALFRTLAVLAAFVDLTIANKPLNFPRDKELIENAPRIAEAPPADHGRYFYYPAAKNMHPSYVSVQGTPTFEKATEIALNNLLPNAGMLYGFDYFQDIDALARRTYTEFLIFINSIPSDRQARLLRAINIKYLVSFHPLDIKSLRLLREYPEHYSWLYEIPNALPRAHIVFEAVQETNPISTLGRLASDNFDAVREVVLDAPVSLQESDKSIGKTVISRYENSRVQIDAQLSAPGILVLNDSFDPGWKVFVNGKEQRILRANYFFRGVALPAGKHRVEFVYDPLSFRIGLMVSSLTLMLLFAVPLVGWLLQRVARRQPQRELCQSPVTSLPDRSTR